MYIRISYDKDFDDLYMSFKSRYPEKLFELEGIAQTDMNEFSRKFFSAKVTPDVSVDANANVDDTSVIAYAHEFPKPYFKLNSYFVLWKELKKLYGLKEANRIIEMQFCGDIYIHDFHGIAVGSPYCFNYSSYDIMMKGLPMVKKIKSVPPKYLYSFKSQLEQFVVIASNSTMGATGLADLLIIMSYYVKNILDTKKDAHFSLADEESCWSYVKENIVSFIYTINQPMRANQSPFTNVSVYDKYFLEEMCKDYLFLDGSSPDIEIVQKIQDLYLDIMNEEMDRTPITFPVTTACFSTDENNNLRDLDFVSKIAEKNMKFGFINLYNGSTSTLSSCCRLRSDKENKYFNSFGSGSSKIGSLGVCSINFPRIAIKSKGDEDVFISSLSSIVEDCARINNAKRNIVKKRIDNGNLPLYSHNFINLSKQYSTVGVNGLNECVEIMGKDILDSKGQDFVLHILSTINGINDAMEDRYNAPHNCEQVPGENMSIKVASKDKLLNYQDKYNLYSNQFIPLVTKADLFDRINLQGLFDKHFSGGAICHLNMEYPIESVATMISLMKIAAKKGVVYYAFNYNLCECVSGHLTGGKGPSCSICGMDIINNYTRIVGFLTNVKNWASVRREEDYPNRQWYDSDGSKKTLESVKL